MNAESRCLSLSAAGRDAPGLVARITEKVFALGGNIIDVEENCRQGLFSIFLIVDFAAAERPMQALADELKTITGTTGLQVIVGDCDTVRKRPATAPEHHLITIIGEDRPGIIAKVSRFFYDHNINIDNCRMIARGSFFSMEMTIDTRTTVIKPGHSRKDTLAQMKRDLKTLCTEMGQSVVVQSGNIYRQDKKLVVFDVESALVRNFSLQNFISGIRRRIQYPSPTEGTAQTAEDDMQILIDNARRLKGLPIEELRRLSELLQLNPGTVELIQILKSMGFKVALISSGFHFFIKTIFEATPVDYAFSNTLKADTDGITTGELEAPIITSESKQEILELIMDLEAIGPEQVIAVGGGAGRSEFIRHSGLSIAFQPDEPCLDTDGILTDDRMLNVLYCLGIPKSELEHHLADGPA